MVPVLADVPFLPAGKGALILMLGGLAMLTFCLLFARFSSAHAPPVMGNSAQANRNARRPKAAAAAPVVFRPTSAPVAPSAAVGNTSGAEWVAGLERAIELMHLGRGRILSADADRCAFFLSACGSCRRGSKGVRGCERERKAIERALRAQAPRVHVSEVACNPSGQGACSFDIRRNGYF